MDGFEDSGKYLPESFNSIVSMILMFIIMGLPLGLFIRQLHSRLLPLKGVVTIEHKSQEYVEKLNKSIEDELM